MSTYLSRLVLDPGSRQVRRDLADCQQLHCTILRAFPEAESDTQGVRAQFGVLYRVDSHPRAGEIAVLVQSAVEPDWSALPADYLLPLDDGRKNPDCKLIDGVYKQIAAGDTFVFRLRANPTRRIKQQTDEQTDKRWDGKRVNLQKEADLHAWIERKGKQGGFQILTVRTQVVDPVQERFRQIYGSEPVQREDVPDISAAQGIRVQGRKTGAGRLAFGSVLFEGRLRVTDVERFREALANGIGSGKAYGFGLLSIARGA